MELASDSKDVSFHCIDCGHVWTAPRAETPPSLTLIVNDETIG
jgi:hypothetical protein